MELFRQSQNVQDAARGKILIVDDEPRILRSLGAALKSRFEVSIAPDAIQAQSILETDNDFEVIISDERMPRLSGQDFLKWAKEKHPQCMRILLTSSDLHSLQNAVNSCDTFRCLQKPWNIGELREILEQAVNESRQISKSHQVGVFTNKADRACVLGVLEADKKYLKLYGELQSHFDQISGGYSFKSFEELKQAKSQGQSFGIIFVDITENNLQVSESIRALESDFPGASIVVTGTPASMSEFLAIDDFPAGLNFVSKPMSFVRLQAAVEKALIQFSNSKVQH